MKEISAKELDLLIKNKIVFSSGDGLVDKNGNAVSYARTKHKRHIADRYADIASRLSRNSK